MTTDDRVMAILERANPVPPGELVDVPVGATRYLETALEQRSAPMTVIDPTPTRLSDQPPRRRWPLIAVAASVVAIVVASIALIVATRDDTTVVDTPDPTVPPTLPDTTVPEAVAPVPTTVAAPDPAAAQAVVDEFFTAYNAGDTDAVLALLSTDAIITETFAFGEAEIDPATGPEDPSEWERLTAWRHGGWELANSRCAQAADQPGEGTAVACEFDTVTTLVAAIGGEPTETIARITVVDGTIAELRIGFGQPRFGDADDAFTEWMNAWHPEATGWALEEWTSFEDAAENGVTRAAYAEEWAAWRGQYDCGSLMRCQMPLDDWVAEYDSQCVGMDPNEANEALVAHIGRLPAAAGSTLPVERLSLADAELTRADLTDARIAELQQTRLDAMIELGIDPACHPTVG